MQDFRNEIELLQNSFDILLLRISKEDKKLVNISPISKLLSNQISPIMDRICRAMIDFSGLLYRMQNIERYIDEANNLELNQNIRIYTQNQNNFNLDTQLEVEFIRFQFYPIMVM